MRNTFVYSSTVFLLLSSSLSYATCNRDDVNFYLKKGFTTTQITSLCNQPTSQKDTKKTASTNTTSQDDTSLFLSQAIKAKNISVDDDALHYTRKVCIEYGEEDLFGFKPKTCPNVKYTVSLNQLIVTNIGKENVFYGEQQVHIKSTIQREIVGGLSDLESLDRELALDTFETGDETVIPVRDDFSMDEVQLILEGLANQ